MAAGRVAPTQDRRALIDMLHAAFEVGLNYFDTAPDYGRRVQRGYHWRSRQGTTGRVHHRKRRPKLLTPRASWRMWMGV